MGIVNFERTKVRTERPSSDRRNWIEKKLAEIVELIVDSALFYKSADSTMSSKISAIFF